jgi:hypothetical protein
VRIPAEENVLLTRPKTLTALNIAEERSAHQSPLAREFVS